LRGKLHSINFGEGAHDKTGEGGTHVFELWDAMKKWLPGAMIPADGGEKGSPSHQMTDRGWRWSGREEHKKRLESKDELQRRGVGSPHDADALCCTFHVNPPRRLEGREQEPDDDAPSPGWMTSGDWGVA
jgi:hypothetical protein